MSLSRRSPRIIRSALGGDEVYVLGRETRARLAPAGPVAEANALITAAETRARQIVADAETRSRALIAEAEAGAGAVRESARTEGRKEGYEAGVADAHAEYAEHLTLVRRVVQEGQQLRQQLANDAGPLIARAVMLATRRIVGEYYEADPQRTVAAVQEALRATAGQDLLRIRVNPGVVDRVSASLRAVEGYITPDEGVAIGGCIVDLKEGTLDATLDARLNLMDLALGRAGGEAAE